MLQIFDAFLARKTDLNAQDKVNGETALHKAILNPTVRLLIVRLLLDHKVNPNIPNAKGDTPLHYSINITHSQ
jgi:ankyrin repeat protein